jgi:hypothetical protein
MLIFFNYFFFVRSTITLTSTCKERYEHYMDVFNWYRCNAATSKYTTHLSGLPGISDTWHAVNNVYATTGLLTNLVGVSVLA